MAGVPDNGYPSDTRFRPVSNPSDIQIQRPRRETETYTERDTRQKPKKRLFTETALFTRNRASRKVVWALEESRLQRGRFLSSVFASGTEAAMNQHTLPGLEPDASTPLLNPKTAGDADVPFDWWTDSDGDVIVESQQAIAVYRNRRNHVVIRAERQVEGDEDSFIHLSTPTALKALIDRLQRELREGF